jgi:hypothetical protein
VTLEVTVANDSALTLSVGPFDPALLDAELAREASDGVDLRRVLETVADSLRTSERADGAWVELTKQLEPAHG